MGDVKRSKFRLESSSEQVFAAVCCYSYIYCLGIGLVIGIQTYFTHWAGRMLINFIAFLCLLVLKSNAV